MELAMAVLRGPIARAAFLLLGIGLVGCRDRSKEIVILGEDAANLQAIERVLPEFTSETGIPVRVVRQPFDVAQAQAAQDLAQGSGLYDVILQYNTELAPFTRNGWVKTLDDLARYLPEDRGYEESLFPQVWREVGFFPARAGSDSLVAVGYPFAANTMLLVYNRQMLENPDIRARYRALTGEDLTVPRTWQQYRAYAEAATDRAAGTFGVVLQGASGWIYYEWTNFAFGMGGGVMDKKYGWESDPQTPLRISSPETVAATEFYVGLAPFNNGDFFSTGQTEQRAIMEQGRTAMAIMWSDIAVPLAGDSAQRFGFAPIPGDVSMTAGGSFFVNRATRQPENVARLLSYLMRPDVQARLLNRGLSSPSRAAYDAPQNRDLPFAPALKTSLDRGTYMLEAGPDAVAIQQILETYLQRAWRREATVPDLLRRAETEVREARTKLLDEANR